VLPGFVESHGHVGIHEEAEGWAGNDTNEMTNPNGAALRALDAINVEDEGFRDALSGGVTSVVVKPGSGNPIGGQTVAIKTWGGRTVDEQVIAEAVSVKSALGENPKRVYGDKKQTPSTRLGVAKVIREAFVAAQDYAAARAHAESEGKPFTRDLAKETLARVLDGELVWDQHTHRADDIATALRLADEFGYRLVINHGTDGAAVADVLAERDVPVIFGPMFTTRSKVELRNRRRGAGRDHHGPPGGADQLPRAPGVARGEGGPRPAGRAGGAHGEPGGLPRPRRPGGGAGAGPRRRRRRLVGRPAGRHLARGARVRHRHRGLHLGRRGRRRAGRGPRRGAFRAVRLTTM
jgi:hypothetical protein